MGSTDDPTVQGGFFRVAADYLSRAEWRLPAAVLLRCGLDPANDDGAISRDLARRLHTVALGACCTGGLPTVRVAEIPAPSCHIRQPDGTFALVPQSERVYFVEPRAFLEWSAVESLPPMPDAFVDFLTFHKATAGVPELDKNDMEILRQLNKKWPAGMLLADLCEALPSSKAGKSIVGDRKVVSRRLHALEEAQSMRSSSRPWLASRICSVQRFWAVTRGFVGESWLGSGGRTSTSPSAGCRSCGRCGTARRRRRRAASPGRCR